MTKQEAIQQGIALIKGKHIDKGKVVAVESEPRTLKLVRYDGQEAVCEDMHGQERRFPRSELFDPNKLINVAGHLLNLGFWREGMESTVINISK